MLNSSDVLELFIGETESRLGILMGIDPIDSSIEVFLNQGRIKILLNKHQLERLTNNLTKILFSLEDNNENKDCGINDNTFIRR